MANRRSSARSRTSGSSAISALAASMRKRGLEVRAGRAPAQPRELLAQQPLPGGVAGGLQALALGAREHVRGVAALVAVHAPVGHLPGRGAHGVQEPAVVGHHHQRAAALRQVAREPVDPLHVEVVGRLVQQQQLGRVQQQARQRDPAPLAARQRADGRVEAGREPAQVHAPQEAVEDGAERGVGRPLVIGPPAHQLVADGQRGIEVVALGDQGHVEPADAGDAPGVRRLEAADEPQQRQLAVAVAPHHADPLALVDAERDAPQHLAAAVALVDRVQVDQVAGGQASALSASRVGPCGTNSSPTRPR